MIDEEVDAEREYRARTGKVLKRVDRCANQKRHGAAEDCPRNAADGRSYCSMACLQDAASRSTVAFVGGSICNLADVFDDEEGTPPTRNPVR